MTSRQHNVTVWARDKLATQWAWSCLCGTRFLDDLPSRDQARNEAHAHASAAR